MVSIDLNANAATRTMERPKLRRLTALLNFFIRNIHCEPNVIAFLAIPM